MIMSNPYPFYCDIPLLQRRPTVQTLEPSLCLWSLLQERKSPKFKRWVLFNKECLGKVYLRTRKSGFAFWGAMKHGHTYLRYPLFPSWSCVVGGSVLAVQAWLEGMAFLQSSTKQCPPLLFSASSSPVNILFFCDLHSSIACPNSSTLAVCQCEYV